MVVAAPSLVRNTKEMALITRQHAAAHPVQGVLVCVAAACPQRPLMELQQSSLEDSRVCAHWRAMAAAATLWMSEAIRCLACPEGWIGRSLLQRAQRHQRKESSA